MRKIHFPLLLLLILSMQMGYAQKSSVKGVLYDTLVDAKIPRAVITLIQHKDSVMAGFTRSNAAGEFVLPNVNPGKYVVMIYHPIYAGYSDVIDVKAGEAHDLGNIQLLTAEMLLKEVTVISADAIKIKGDTIEYTADSFKVQQNASVEDLLKKLPGIQVNKNGEITAQGKRVEKVLVDGEEFFSDDPTVATQNLRAEAVDKVQVFEKKDEMSGSTDQGSQTINITLKEDAKKGVFGKLKAGAGFDQDQYLYYGNEAMINRFKPKQRASAYILHSNTGKLNLDWEESQQYGDNSNTNFSEDGFMFRYNDDSDDEFVSYGNGYNGSGIPASISGGATFSNKWKEDKHQLSASYQYKQVENEAKSRVISENFLTNASYLKDDTTTTRTNVNRHSLNLKYEVKLDTMSTLKWVTRGSKTFNKKDNFYFSETNNLDGTKINSNDRTTFTNSDVLNINTNLNYLRKFRKTDRRLNIYTEFSNKDTDGESALNSYNRIYGNNDTLLSFDTTDQQKTIAKTEMAFKANFTYKEPISKTSILEFRYYYNMNAQDAGRFTYDRTNSGEYIDRIDALSSDYVYDFQSHRAGVNYNYKKDKITFKFGSDIAKQFYTQADQLHNTQVNRDFINVFPNASFVYSFNKMKQLRFNYNGYTQQPSISQIQPLRDNTDPFNITVGNENLNPSFTNDFNLQYFSNQVLKSRYFYAWSDFNYTLNDIVTSTSIDSVRRNITQYVNKTGNMNGSLSIGYYINIKKIDANAHAGTSVNYSKNLNIVNTVLNTTTNNSFGFDIGLDKNLFKEKLTTSIGYNFYNNISGSTIQNNATIQYWTQNINGYFEYNVSKRIVLNTGVNYSLRQKTELFNQNNNVFIWDASIDCKVFKDKSGVFTFEVNDILNQNLGFQRNASAYSITQTRYNVIKRYFMLSFTWNFNSQKPKGVEEKKE